ncbi:ASCH domain-containing protein [Pedococcus sp. 5OH_020]|uniref:ASCH domain-containing protein n=1 Tax=Pedococcus sp. 5OH_020 TaxID=2989814 RepID=UPI0022E9A2A8|nr:ASCH domain-containing protein [Pedococcus sp. 5OH_020]
MNLAPADQTAVEAMWASYVADTGYDGPLVTTYAFGDSAELADELGLLVLHGPKRATAGLVQEFDAGEQALPEVGDRCAVLGGDGRPLAIVRTTDVRVGPLASVDDRFAWDEGEGDRTRAWWLAAHTGLFIRQCATMGLTFSDNIGVVFERFDLVWPACDHARGDVWRPPQA